MKKQIIYNLGFIFLSLVLMLSSVLLGKLDVGGETVAASVSEPERRVIVIDAGHGGEDGGCTSSGGVLEKDLNLMISKKVAALLSASGCDVAMTREADTMIYDMYGDLAEYSGHKKMYDLKNRVKFADETSAEVFVSIHMNKFPESKYNGLQVYYSSNHEASATLAEAIRVCNAEYLQPDNTRQTKPSGSNIFILHRLEIPAVLVECGFLSNPEETELLCDEKYQNKLALIIASSILEFKDS